MRSGCYPRAIFRSCPTATQRPDYRFVGDSFNLTKTIKYHIMQLMDLSSSTAICIFGTSTMSSLQMRNPEGSAVFRARWSATVHELVEAPGSGCRTRAGRLRAGRHAAANLMPARCQSAPRGCQSPAQKLPVRTGVLGQVSRQYSLYFNVIGIVWRGLWPIKRAGSAPKTPRTRCATDAEPLNDDPLIGQRQNAKARLGRKGCFPSRPAG